MSAIPEATKDGLTFFPIPKIDRAEQVFGQDESAFFNRRSLPDVPREHKNTVSELFFSGGKLPDLDPRVDRALATGFIQSLLSSFAPAHESKEATAAYALWVWTSAEAIDAALAPFKEESQ